MPVSDWEPIPEEEAKPSEQRDVPSLSLPPGIGSFPETETDRAIQASHVDPFYVNRAFAPVGRLFNRAGRAISASTADLSAEAEAYFNPEARREERAKKEAEDIAMREDYGKYLETLRKEAAESPRNIDVALFGKPGEQLPFEKESEVLSEPAQFALRTSHGVLEGAPRMAAVMGAQAVGIPAPVAAAAVFGATEEGFDPKQAAIGAAIPFVGKYSGELAGIVAKKFGVSNQAAFDIVRGLGATAGPAAPLIAEGEYEISKLPEEQRHKARLELYASIAGQAALGPMGLERKGVKNALEPKTTQPVRDVRAQPGEGAGEVSAAKEGEGVSQRGGEAKPEVGELGAKGNLSATEIADQLGIRFDLEVKDQNLWMFTAYDKSGEQSTSFLIKKGATPEEITAKYNKVRESYGTQENAPRPIGAAKETTVKDADIRDIVTMPIDEFHEAIGKHNRKSDVRDLAEKLTTPEQIREAELFAQRSRERGRAMLEDAETAKDAGKPWEGRVESAQRENQRTQLFEEAARSAKAAKAISEGMAPNKAATLYGVDEGRIPKVETVDKAKELQDLRALRDKGTLTEDQTARLNELEKLSKASQGNREAMMKELQELQAKQKAAAAPPVPAEPVPTPAEPLPTGVSEGPGAARPEDVGTKTALESLTDAARTMAEANKETPQLERSYSLAERMSQWKDLANRGLDGLKAAAEAARAVLRDPPKWNDYKAALGRRQVALSQSVLNARRYVEEAMQAVPKAQDREAISNWVEHNGDRRSLLRAMAETDPQYEAGYQRALSLPPDLVTVARNIQNYFETRLQHAIDAGILEDGVENYIRRLYEKDSPWKNRTINELRSGVFTGKPGLAKQRVFQYDFEAEKAGYKPVKDFVQRVAQYDMALNKAIADRQYVRELMQRRMSDGRPMIDVGGRGDKVGGVGADAAFLIKPTYKPNLEAREGMSSAEQRNVQQNNRGDYIPFDHPALRKWKWVEEDAEGSPIMVQGNVLVHPEALKDIKAVFGESLLRKSTVGRAALGVSSTIKQTMLDLSGFHPTQITVHGWEHRADVPLSKWTAKMTGREFKEIDLNDPVQRALVEHGTVVADHSGYELFSEGLTGGSLTKHIPKIGPKLQEYNRWLFQDYIPRLKMNMAMKALERNRKAYAKDLASGKMTEDQLLHLTSNEANAAFGELNYEMMGRNKTLQDVFRLGLLAPDFLEARGRFAGQAAKTLVGGYGREQAAALAFGAVTMYVTARIMNKLIDGQYHFEPEHAFDVVHNGRAYSLRTVQGDIIHAATHPRAFVYTRLNPVTTRTLFEAVTGRDQFGRPRSAVDQVKDFAGTVVPISFRGLFKGQEQKLWESFLNSFGITERRATATDSVWKLVKNFKEKNNITEPGEFIYDPEKDPYRQIKLALMYNTPEAAAQEIKLALDSEKVDWKHMSNYFDNFGKRPFTGGHKTEIKFWQSLSEDEKKTYRRAIEERKQIRKNAGQAFKIFRQQLSGQTP